ncbi:MULTISPECIES: S-layer homology domain-containing protein [unclassified Lysinibacillus]|uniref:S-layer homology domain-containing protein n=1 Tax=unclassified Lysinibacillus TaxID=2636778 RepID=UPI0038190683
MGKKIFIITLCSMLITFSQLTGISLMSPLKADAATCDTPNLPKCTQDLTQSSWLNDTTNGFIVSGIPEDNGFDLLKYSDGQPYPAGYYIDANEFSPPKSIKISAGEGFTDGIFDLKSLKIDTINPHMENDALRLKIQGYDIDGNPKGNPVTFKTVANSNPIYDIPLNMDGINSFVITASVQYIPTVFAGIWDITFTQFTIDIPTPSNPPTITNDAITASNITASGVQLDWAKASDDLTTQGDLQYRVYQSTSHNMDTVSNIESNGTALGSGYAKDITSFIVTGLAANTIYYFNVIVKDADGNKSAYMMQQVTTVGLNKPPTSSDGTVNVNEGQVYTFNSTSFAFSDEDAGDTLQAIQIVTIPNSGQLFIDSNNNQQVDAGEAITNGVTTISKANLDTGHLKYLMDNGSTSSFTFKVSDGINFSTSYTMNLNVDTNPTVTISSNQSNLTNSNPITISIVFSEPVVDFTVLDVKVTNGNVWSIYGDGTRFTGTISPIADGVVKVKIPEKVVTNSSGTFNKASNELQIIYDATPPTNIELTNTIVQEKAPIGTPIGTLTATDSGSAQTFRYALKSGDTSFFTIEGNVLKTNALFTYDTKNSYRITISVTDQAGNTSDKEFTIQITKNHAPTGTILINNGAVYTSSSNVTLTMTATDIEGEAIDMRFSNDGFTWSSWESKVSTKSWTLSSGDGSKTVYMQLKDSAGNISNAFSNTIGLDTTPPFITGVTNGGMYNTDVTISFNEGTATLNGSSFKSGSTVTSIGSYTLVVTDSVGNTSTISFEIDKTLPQAVEVTIKSTNFNPTKAKIGDTITLAIKTDKNIQTPTVTIAGKTAAVSGAATNWQATHVIANGDIEGSAPFTINFKDLLGNSATEVTSVTDGSFVIVDSKKPTVKKLTMASNNANPAVAKVGNIITIDFETSEDIQLPKVAILGQTANVSDKGDGDAKTWQANYTLKSVDTDGPINFTIDYQDLAGNDGSQVTEISTGAMVEFDKKAPEITTYYPAHLATNALPTGNLVLTFNEKILPVASKNIFIRNASTNQIIETIGISQANVSITNETVTINPTVDLDDNTVYSIQIDAGAFIDLAGNMYDGITNNTTWSFTTSAIPTYTVTYDSNGAVGGKVPTDSKQYKGYETITVLGNTDNLRKTGYTFVGWNTKADGKGIAYKAGQMFQIGKGNLLLYAEWFKNDVPADGGSFTPSTDPVVPNNQFLVNVVDPSMPDEVLIQSVLTRVFRNGSFQDTVNFTVANANEFLRKLANKEEKRPRLMIPDMEQPASETKVILAREAAKRLLEGKSNFGIDTGLVKIDVPFASMNDFNDDIYFRMIPIKDALLQKAIEDRAKQAELVLQQSHGVKVKLVGQPVTIDTNLQNRPVTLLLPLPANLTSAQQESIVIYVEHSNGTVELIRGRIVEFSKGQTGIVFDVHHFSTFTLLYVEQGQEEEQQPEEVDRKLTSYIQGYTDGTFRPNAYVTRAQMAAMLARNLSDNDVPVASQLFYVDTAATWAKNEIEYIRTQKIMQGRQDRVFAPNDMMTRAQMAVIAVRWIEQQCAEGSKDNQYCQLTTKGETYSDVAPTHWAANEIDRISAMGIMIGSGDGQFRPEERLTRAQAVKILNRIFNRPLPTEETEQIFIDIPSEHWAFFEIQAATTK